MNDATGITAELALEAPPATRRAARPGKSPAQALCLVAIAISVVMVGIAVTTLLAARPRHAAPGDLPSPSTGRGGASEPGWSVVSHADHSYLYAHCYRQFGWDLFPFADPPFRAHDWSCGPNVTVARVPRGQFDATREYWSGADWTDDPSTAAPVFPRDDRPVNPAQVAVLDGEFVAVTKVGDWWGQTIRLDTAAAPQGPWQSYETITSRRSATSAIRTSHRSSRSAPMTDRS